MAIHVSYSALSDFISCSRKSYYRIFEPEVSVPNVEMMMGSITHKVIEKSWNDENSASQLIDQLVGERGLDEKARNSIYHFVQTYFERFRVMLRDDDKIEKRFKVKLYDDVFLVGVFDRVTLGVVIDWKTNANPPKKLDNNIQFILYDLAYHLVYGKPADGLYWASLSNGNLIRYSESKMHSSTLMEDIIPFYVETVRKKLFKREGLFNGACYRCPYKLKCLGGESNVMVHSTAIEE